LARRALNVYLDEDDPPALSRLSDFLGFYSPKHHDPEIPSISALIAAIANHQVFCLGPAEFAQFRFLGDALAIILKHSELFLNGLQGADRTEAQDFLGKVQKQIAWQLGEK